jgi:hypothetical protein
VRNIGKGKVCVERIEQGFLEALQKGFGKVLQGETIDVEELSISGSFSLEK